MRLVSYFHLSAFTIFFLVTLSCHAQRGKRNQRERSPRQELVYDNRNYLSEIRSIALHPVEQEAGFPVIFMEQTEPLVLSFDDLRGDVRNFYFSIEHCTADWKSSGLSPLEYAAGYNEDRIDSYKPSVNTLQPYTHYRVEIPSRQVRPKLPGNYLLKVYEDADKRRLILTRRFYVVQQGFDLDFRQARSMDNRSRTTHHKWDFTIRASGLTVNNPYKDLKVLVMQNQRPDVQEWLRKPSFIGNNEFRYEAPGTLLFPAGNEFRSIDIRSLKLASERVADLRTDSLVNIRLTVDEDLSDRAYGSLFDEDGAFFIRNLDRQNALDESDYAQVTFSLDTGEPNKESGDLPTSAGIYVVGAFNAYRLSTDNRLTFNPRISLWQTTLPLKQGVYDYEYIYRDQEGKIQPFRFSGSHYQTGNQYQVLVYYRRPGTTWDEIRGFIQR